MNLKHDHPINHFSRIKWTNQLVKLESNTAKPIIFSDLSIRSWPLENLLTLDLRAKLIVRGVCTCSCGRSTACHSISARLSFITWVFNSLPQHNAQCLWRLIRGQPRFLRPCHFEQSLPSFILPSLEFLIEISKFEPIVC